MTADYLATVKLGRSNITIPRFALGTAPIGNLFAAVDDAVARETVLAAWASGIRLFDTAPHYGLGLAETRLGRTLAAVSSPRDAAVISTKVGRRLNPVLRQAEDNDDDFVVRRTHTREWDFSAAGVRTSLFESRARLAVDQIDIALLHDPDNHLDQAVAEAYPALDSLRRSGEIRAVGAGMNAARPLARLVVECELDVVLLAGRYTLLDQSALDSLLPVAAARGTAVLIGGVFNSGMLARPWPSEAATYDYGTAPTELLHRARQIATICNGYGVTLPQAALQFSLGHPAVAAVVVGARSAAEVCSDINFATTTAPAQLWTHLRDKGLIRPDAPLPGMS